MSFLMNILKPMTKNTFDPGSLFWNKDKKDSNEAKNVIKNIVDPAEWDVNKNEPDPGPAPAAPLVMPTPDDDAVKAAKRRHAATMRARGGRASTILAGEDLLGG